MIITDFDPIDIPEQTAREREPIHIVQRGHPAWPDAEFTILFDYNNAAGYWVWQVDLDGHGTIIERQPAEYAHKYRYRDYVLFMFVGLSADAESVTPDTLGSEVDLIAVPGLHSPGFGGWIDRQQVEPDEKEKLLDEWNNNVIQ